MITMNVASYFDSMDYAPSTEDDSKARAWLTQHNGAFGHFIGGAFTDPAQGFETIEPATGNRLAQVSQGTQEDVDRAVAAARKAQKGWAALPGHERALKLYALARIIQRNARVLAVVEALDNGKSIRETRDIDIPLAARHFYHHAGWAQLQDQQFPDYDPVGVIGQVIPWNFPFLMLAWKVAPALALGNTVVLKPAESTPLTALLFAELAQAAGLPDGVLNIVTGDGETGALIAAHDGVDKVAFTTFPLPAWRRPPSANIAGRPRARCAIPKRCEAALRRRWTARSRSRRTISPNDSIFLPLSVRWRPSSAFSVPSGVS